MITCITLWCNLHCKSKMEISNLRNVVIIFPSLTRDTTIQFCFERICWSHTVRVSYQYVLLLYRPSAERTTEEDYEEDIIQPDEITVQNPLSQKAEPVLTPLGKSQHPLISDITHTHTHTRTCIYTGVYGTVYSNAYMGGIMWKYCITQVQLSYLFYSRLAVCCV